MNAKLWKNQISNNLKKAIQEEIKNLLDEKTKEIKKENKRLQEDNLFIRKQFKGAVTRLKNQDNKNRISIHNAKRLLKDLNLSLDSEELKEDYFLTVLKNYVEVERS